MTRYKLTGAIKPVLHKSKIYYCLAFDTETRVINDGKGNITFPFRLGVATFFIIDNKSNIIEKQVYRFNTQRDFIRIIDICLDLHPYLHIFAHNVGFDIRVLDLIAYFNRNNWLSEPPIINGRLFCWELTKNKKHIKILDTANYGVISIEQLGKDFGYNKGNVDFDNTTDAELFEYCERDVEIVVRFIHDYIRFCNKNKLGELQISLASQSLTAFRARFIQRDIVLHNNKEAIKLERQAYHGGRVECFRIGKMPKDTYYYVDINSMYPYVMLNKDLPYKLIGYQDDIPLRFLRGRLAMSYAIADVSLRTNTNAFPIIYDKKLVFPIGTYRTTLHNSELQLALDNDDIVKIHSCAIYEKDILFNKYVDFFYKAKQKATIDNDKSWRYISKLFMNSLYGKFGQTSVNREIIGHLKTKVTWRVTSHDQTTGIRFQEFAWNGVVYRETKQGEAYISFPALAGAITAEARMYLFSLIQKAGASNVVYTDTDSLIINAQGKANLETLLNELELGMLKIEHISEDVTIYNAKDYKFGDISKTKGIPKKATQLDKNIWQYLQFEGFLKWLSGDMDKGATGKISTRERKSTYNKGIIKPDGLVTPYVLSEF